MNYRFTRDCENLNRLHVDGVGRYGIPPVSRAEYRADNWISFNYARTCEEPERHGIHFFVDDYQFVRLWDNPDAYLNMLSKFQAVCTPDFSMYTDWPKAVQIYNSYRRHWLGAYWQEHGIRVIPTIGWSDEESFDWCFDGDPTDSMVAVSSVGTQGDERASRLFVRGYKRMMDRLRPSCVLFYGIIPEECGGNIIHVRSFAEERWRSKNRQESAQSWEEEAVTAG